LLWAALGGLAIGLALGLLGGGGSTLTVPLLLALGVEPKAAIALSLAVVGTTAGSAVVSHARAQRVDWRAVAWLLPAVALGGRGRAAAHFRATRAAAGLRRADGQQPVSPCCFRDAWRHNAASPRGGSRLAAAGLAARRDHRPWPAGGAFLFVPALASRAASMRR
jgi:hypothetical protein